MSDSPFAKSAEAAVSFLSGLIRVSAAEAKRESMPSILEMLTVCRETGCKLPELEAYARAVDAEEVVMLCGGTADLAEAVARRLGYDTGFHAVEGLPVIWRLQGGGKNELQFKHGLTETRLTPTALYTLLDKKLGKDRLMTIQQRVNSDNGHVFVWIPNPETLESFFGDAQVFETYLSHRLMIAVESNTPPETLERLREMGQFFLQLSAEQAQGSEFLSNLDSALTNLHDADDRLREQHAAALWAWLVPRLIEATGRTKQQYALMIDRQTHKLNSTRQLLREYRRNWISGIKNQSDSYLHTKIMGKNFESFYHPKNPGPELETFMTAIGINGLKQKLAKSMTDRMAEFVAGLSALATKVELRQIALNDINTLWNPSRLNPEIVALLTKNKVFSDGGGAKVGLVGSLRGKSDEVINERKGEIARGCRYVTQVFESKFATWCDSLMQQVEKQVNIQIAANLVNQGLPEADALREAMEGLDRLAAMIQGDSTSSSTEPDSIVKSWLLGLASRRIIPAYSASSTD